jgi:hypothetical protein
LFSGSLASIQISRRKHNCLLRKLSYDRKKRKMSSAKSAGICIYYCMYSNCNILEPIMSCNDCHLLFKDYSVPCVEKMGKM